MIRLRGGVVNHVSPFLELNGFTKTGENVWSNELCSVEINENEYIITNNEGWTMYSTSHSIYWLIGILTYCGYMKKDYKQYPNQHTWMANKG
jgi:hypothetical protein